MLLTWLYVATHYFMAYSSGFDDLLEKLFPSVRIEGLGENLRINLLARLTRYLNLILYIAILL